MGDDRELQQTSIPMPDNESSQPPQSTAADLAPENVPSGIVPTGFHQCVREFQGTAVQAAKIAKFVHIRLAILLMIWLLINLRVRSLRKKIILGSELWQWTLLIVIIFCGYSVISMVTSLVVHYFTKACKKRYSAVYYAEGLRRSVNFTLLSILLVLTWHFYFRTDKGLSCILGAALHLGALSPTADLEFKRLTETSKVLVEHMKARQWQMESSTHTIAFIAHYLKLIANVWPRDLEDDATAPIREIL
ncbi:hypothetical protein Nepgr_030470 [Nepenthes gracilis]|uniref:Uncharacterized protein n=1 Tax=Nepenthes gracilis TaxID=150966 RepID=A0AAD3TFU7_NEPGR|nr:hypothetical protein Nepgr_030470 [Nepenthes gracilis]